MKKYLSLLISCVLLIGVVPIRILPVAHSANIVESGTCGENVTYTLDSEGLLTISGSGEMKNYAAFDTYDDSPFSWNNSIKIVVIEQGVTTIGDGMFICCDGISSISIPNTIQSIGDRAIYNCNELLAVNIPDSVVSIGDEAISCCNKLSSIIIPDSVTSLGPGAIFGNDSLVNVRLPNRITKLESSLLALCPKLTSITIPESVVYIDWYAFSGCTGLTSVNFPAGLKTIDRYAFDDCISLKNIKIPNGVTSIGEHAFRGCSGLESIEVEVGNKKYHSAGNCIIETESKELVLGCKTSVIPNDGSVTSIGWSAFNGCAELTELYIPETISYIRGDSFAYCTGLETIEVSEKNNYYHSTGNCIIKTKTKSLVAGCKNSIIPDDGSVTGIGNYSFDCCTELSKIIIPNSVTSIGYHAFTLCEKLSEIWIPEATISISEDAFTWCEELTIHGVAGSYAQTYAEANNIPFSIESIEDDADLRAKYYAISGPVMIVPRDDKGYSIVDFTVSIGATKIYSDSTTCSITIPDGYTGDIVVSKPGYIDSTLPVECIKKYNFFRMFKNETDGPLVKQFLIKKSGFAASSYNDLLKGHEPMYDSKADKHDLFLDIDENNTNITRIYLSQDSKSLILKNGINNDLSINSTFRSDGGNIYLCIETADGKQYKQKSNIDFYVLELDVKLDESATMSTVIEDDIDAVNGQSVNMKWKFGSLPVSLTISDDGYKVKGTIGVVGEEKYTASYHDYVKELITTHESGGNTEYSNLEMARLDKYLKDNKADIVESYSSFGISVTAKIIGYIDATLNHDTGKLENMKIGAIASIGGGISYTQQSIAAIGLPYYWTVKLSAELSSKIELEKNGDTNMKFTIKMPEVSAAIKVSGDLCLGFDKIAGAGGRVTGSLDVNFKGPDYDFNSSVWSVSLDFAVLGQLAGKELAFSPFGNKIIDYQIWPEIKNNKSKVKKSLSTLADGPNVFSYQINERYRLKSFVFDKDTDDGILKRNGYTYSSPESVVMSDGRILFIWVDYDDSRSYANQTALFYSIYDPTSDKWADPLQVEKDGTPDDFPVLKKIGNEIYLAWNDAKKTISDESEIQDLLASMEISVARFDGNSFVDINTITDNNSSDIIADIADVNGKPVLLWLQNEFNNVVNANTGNRIMCAALSDSAWKNETIKDDCKAINSIVGTEENGHLVVYYSMCTSNDYSSMSDYRIFSISLDSDMRTETQITDSEEQNLRLYSFDNTVNWQTDTGLKVQQNDILIDETVKSYRFLRLTDGKLILLYIAQKSDGRTALYMRNITDSEESASVEIYSSDYLLCGFTAFAEQNGVTIILNEIDEKSYVSQLRLISIPEGKRIYIKSADYNKYSLSVNNNIDIDAVIENKGFDYIDNIRLMLCSGDSVLYDEPKTVNLPSGGEDYYKICVSMSEAIIKDQLVLSILQADTNEVLSEYVLQFNQSDISVENACLLSDTDGDKICVSIVNRGVTRTESSEVQLRSDNQDDPILMNTSIKSLAPGEEQVCTFNLNSDTNDYEVYYLLVPFQDDEMFIANNSDYCIKHKTELNPLFAEHDHKWDSGEITKVANCITDGVKTFTCAICKETKTETIKVTGHKLTKTAAKAATCTASGNVEYYTCSVCKKTFSDAKGTKAITDVTVKVAGHKLTKTAAKAATCTASGNVEYYTCSVCKKTFSDAKGTKEIADVKVKAAGHKLTKTTANAATCTADGNVEYYTCSVCKKTFSDAKGTKAITDVKVKAAGHKLSKIAAKAATCTAAGNVEYYTCSVCKKTFSDAKGTKEIVDVIVKAAGHSFSVWTVTKEATVAEEGAEIRKCSKCGFEETRPIKKLEITYTAGDIDGNGRILADDARLALRASAKLENLDEKQKKAADVNEDGKVLADDARQILRYSAKLQHEFEIRA